MKSNQSKEDYLKAVFMIRNETGQCRSVDVAERLGISRASVSRAVKRLTDGGLLIKKYDGQLILTENGEKRATAVENAYVLLHRIFLSLGVSSDIAEKDANSMEHCISHESYKKLQQWYQQCESAE